MNKINFSKLFELKLAIVLTLTASSALVYRLYALNAAGIAASLLLSGALLLILAHFGLNFNAFLDSTYPGLRPPLSRGELSSQFPSSEGWRQQATGYVVLQQGISWSFTALFGLLLFVLFLSSTNKSIISPWEVIPGWFFYLYFAFLLLGLTILIWLKKSFPLWLIFAINFSIIIIIYRIGYGYDFFIHGASLKLINDFGEVLPKTNFYLGQYGLLIVLHKLTFIPLYWLHKLLVPLLTVACLPYFLLKYFKTKNYPGWLALTILILPLGFLTYTTPQNFGYLLLVLLVLNLGTKGTAHTVISNASEKSLKDYFYNFKRFLANTQNDKLNDRNDLLLNILLVLAGLTIHPISGIPGLILFALYYCKNKIARGAFLLVALISLPALYFSTLPTATLNWPDLAALVGNSAFSLPYKFDYVLNSVYLFGFNQIIIVTLLTFGGFLLIRKNQQHLNNVWLSLILLISSLLMSSVQNSSLIGYEQTDYAERLHVIILIMILPIVFESFAYLYQKIKDQNYGIRLGWLGILLFAIMANFYLSYPRNDNYYNSRGISIGQSDLDAVAWINDNEKSDFIVLADQQVSAAALHLYGFKKYYHRVIPVPSQAEDKSLAGIQSSSNDSIFYYPVPTGGPLYRYYLDMVYQAPSATTMTKAEQLAGVNTGYFVLNKYWTDFPKILEEAKITAKSYRSFGNGEVWVFEY